MAETLSRSGAMSALSRRATALGTQHIAVMDQDYQRHTYRLADVELMIGQADLCWWAHSMPYGMDLALSYCGRVYFLDVPTPARSASQS